MSPLVIENVEKRFRQGDRVVTALDAISLEVRQGQFLAVMGASGSGKSTLLHLMAGLAQADSGQVLVNGQNLAAMNDRQLTLFRRRHIGLVFQAFNLIPTLSAQENVALPLMLDGRNGQSDARVNELMENLGLAARRSHRPDAMSGGEQQRVAIGRALANDPAVILADEPTGNLDQATGEEVLRIFDDLVGQGKTVIMVTHNAEYRSRVHRVLSMHQGRLVG